MTAYPLRNILSTERLDSSKGNSISATGLVGGFLGRVGLEVDPREYPDAKYLDRLCREGPAEDISVT